MRRNWLSFLVFSIIMAVAFSAEAPTGSAATVSKLIIINKKTNRLEYYSNGKFVKEFKVATGKTRSLTPEGKFKIVKKIVNRPYYTGHIPGGDPRNPLGNRWMGLNARGTWGTIYGIHGNNNPSSIGTYASHGCVRMYDNEVEWLYGQVPINTPVIIAYSGKTFKSIAADNGYQVTGGPSAAAVPVSINGSVLQRGSQGTAVKVLQQKLTALGYNTKGIDGVFGANTENAVRLFQKAHHLQVNGIAGPETKQALGIK